MANSARPSGLIATQHGAVWWSANGDPSTAVSDAIAGDVVRGHGTRVGTIVCVRHEQLVPVGGRESAPERTDSLGGEGRPGRGVEPTVPGDPESVEGGRTSIRSDAGADQPTTIRADQDMAGHGVVRKVEGRARGCGGGSRWRSGGSRCSCYRLRRRWRRRRGGRGPRCSIGLEPCERGDIDQLECSVGLIRRTEIWFEAGSVARRNRPSSVSWSPPAEPKGLRSRHRRRRTASRQSESTIRRDGGRSRRSCSARRCCC